MPYLNNILKSCFICLLCLLTTRAVSQKLSDSLQVKFERVLKAALVQDIKDFNSDSLSIAWVTTDSLDFHKTYNSGGVYFSANIYKNNKLECIDTSMSKDRLIIKSNSTFNTFINSVFSEGIQKTRIASIRQTWIYVYIPGEEWQKFYLDSLLGYESLTIRIELDIFSGYEKIVRHRRDEAKITYNTKNGNFILDSIKVLREATFPQIH